MNLSAEFELSRSCLTRQIPPEHLATVASREEAVRILTGYGATQQDAEGLVRHALGFPSLRFGTPISDGYTLVACVTNITEADLDLR